MNKLTESFKLNYMCMYTTLYSRFLFLFSLLFNSYSLPFNSSTVRKGILILLQFSLLISLLVLTSNFTILISAFSSDSHFWFLFLILSSSSMFFDSGRSSLVDSFFQNEPLS